MWILPKPVSNSGKWEVLKSNTFLSLEKQKGLLSKQYRIVLKRKAGFLVVCTSANEADIMTHWDYVEKQLVTSLSLDPEEFDDVIQYLELKFQSLSKTEDDEVHVFFKKTFGIMGENVLDYFSCAYWKGVPKHGWMYITSNFICFTSKMLNNNIVVPFKEVTAIRKEGSINKGIQFTAKSVEYYFAAFMKRDLAFEILEQLWKGALDKLLASAETTLERLDMNSSLERISSSESARRLVRTPSPSNRNIMKRRNSVSEITTERKNEDFRLMFRFPNEETIAGEFVTTLGSDNNSSTLKGILYISQHFYSFHSRMDDTVLVIPFLDIKNITKELLSPKDKTEAIILHLDDCVRFVFYFTQQCDEAYKLSLRLWNVVQAIRTKEESASLIEYLNAKTELPFCDQESQNQKQLWDKYLSKNKRVGFCVLKETQVLKNLLKNGIPDHLRPLLWPICSGSLYKWVNQPGNYKELLDKYYQSDQNNNTVSMSDIDKDLHRSFPFHPFYQRSENLLILRRILVAYSWRNTAIGYTQSMNVVAALLLIVLGEEAAFWLLASICEDLVPDHYGKLLLGPIVDQQMLEVHLKRELPEVFQHLESLSLNLGVLTYGWFMCIFIGYLPIEGSLRVLDIFLQEGKKVLFQISLAIFKMYKENILREKDSVKLVKMLKENMLENNYKDLLKVAFDDFENIPMEDSSALSYRFRAIKTLEDNNKTSQIYSLRNVTNFSSKELDDIHQKFHSNVSVTATYPGLDQNSFKQVIVTVVPNSFVHFLNNHPDTIDLLWKKMLIHEHELLDFSEFASFLSKILKGNLGDRFEFFMDLYDSDGDGCVTKDETLKTVQSIIALYDKMENVDRMSSFVDMIFEQIQDMHDFSNDNYRISTIGKMSSVSVEVDQNGASINVVDEVKIPSYILKKEMITNYKLTGMFRLEITPNSIVSRINSRTRSNTVC